jgi:anti-sigma regulatory factor (Ser/Thr protein kinase)
LREISLHILDIAENGIAAGASCIRIIAEEARIENFLKVIIEDNGKGVPSEKIDTLTDPFVTSRTTRRVGLGLPLLEAAARRCDGKLSIESKPGKGTRITATFRYDHIDRAPMGDMAGTIITLIMGNPDVDFVYNHSIDSEKFNLDTREIRKQLGTRYVTDPAVMYHLKLSIKKQLNQLQLSGQRSEERKKKHGKTDD